MIVYTTDGGARQGEADLWCTYAATRALVLLGQAADDPAGIAAFILAKQNSDGGFAWQRGLPSDMWATYYSTQTLRDLGLDVPDVANIAAWVTRARTADGGFAMMPGQGTDIWATYYAARICQEVLGVPVPDLDALGAWLAATQHADGGLTWEPGSDQPDTRACYYGALAWRAAAGDRPLPVDRPALVSWLQERQAPEGGFGFDKAAEPCVWGTFRAVHALRAVGAGPRDPQALRGWLDARRLAGGGYERWAGYGRPDVWACFFTAGALDGELSDADRAATADFLRSCQIPGSGFTYRAPDAAGDSLATAAALMIHGNRTLAGWLQTAQLPGEDGVMYMPGRGAEMRCTLWAASALSTVDMRLDVPRVASWLRELQNVDGGYGYWHGRGSDIVSTVCAVELAAVCGLDLASAMDTVAVRRFLHAADATGSTVAGMATAGPGTTASGDAAPGSGAGARRPGTGLNLTARMQVARALALLGEREAAIVLGQSAQDCASPLGGYAAEPRAIPDLVSTYQAVLTLRTLGLPVDPAALGRFLDKVRAADGFSWSPLSRQPAGPLAECLGTLLTRATADPDAALPRLNL